MTLISRKEIAQIWGVNESRISQLRKHLPPVIQRCHNTSLYDEDAVIAAKASIHFDENKRIPYSKSWLDNPVNTHLPNYIGFFSGHFDRKDQRKRHQIKKLASKYRQPKTEIVRINADFEI